MYIREVNISDIERIGQIEALTFPPAEAASPETFRYRLDNFPEYFFAAEADDKKIAAFLSGRPVNIPENSGVIDEMYESDVYPEGDTFAILSINTSPEFQNQGFASALICHAIDTAKNLKCKRIILACKEEKLSFYAKFSFKALGLSVSTHGGAVWYDMYLDL